VKEEKRAIAARYVLSKKDRRAFASELRAELGEEAARLVEEAAVVEVVKTRVKDAEVYLVDRKPLFIRLHRIIPSLVSVVKYRVVFPRLPVVVVDDGAVPHLVRGADVMVPGIVEVKGELCRGSLAYVSDLKSRIFVVGEALMNKSEVLGKRRGRALKNLHYAGDKLWKLTLSL